MKKTISTLFIMGLMCMGLVMAQSYYVAEVVDLYYPGLNLPSQCLFNFPNLASYSGTATPLIYPGCMEDDYGMDPLNPGITTGTFFNVNVPGINGYFCGDLADYCDPYNQAVLWELTCGSYYGTQYEDFAGAIRVDCAQVPGVTYGICDNAPVARCI